MLYRYRLFTSDGDAADEAEYAVWIKPGETIYGVDGRELRVLDVVPTEDDSMIYVGC